MRKISKAFPNFVGLVGGGRMLDILVSDERYVRLDSSQLTRHGLMN